MFLYCSLGNIGESLYCSLGDIGKMPNLMSVLGTLMTNYTAWDCLIDKLSCYIEPNII